MKHRIEELERQLAEAQRQRDLYVDLKLGQQRLAEELHAKSLQLLAERDRTLAALRELREFVHGRFCDAHPMGQSELCRTAEAALGQQAEGASE